MATKLFIFLLNTEERKELLKLYYRNNDCARAAARIFIAQFLDKNVQAKYAMELVRKFDETGSVQNKEYNRARRIANEVLVIFAKPTDLGIIDGDLSKIEEHPWMVSLFMDHPYDPTFRCNGFLISESWVVTSSGCLLDGIVSARIGSASLYGGEAFDVINVLKHPNFTFLEDYTYLNDIGLIKVSPNVSASLGVPIRLPEANVGVPVGTIINMTGYGSTVDGGGAYYAYTAVLPIISATDCQDYFQYDLIDDTMMLCAGYSDIQRGYCWGDDGAPAELNGVAIGVASWTPNFCATMPFPTVFTNLTSYVDWIKEVTGV